MTVFYEDVCDTDDNGDDGGCNAGGEEDDDDYDEDDYRVQLKRSSFSQNRHSLRARHRLRQRP